MCVCVCVFHIHAVLASVADHPLKITQLGHDTIFSLLLLSFFFSFLRLKTKAVMRPIYYVVKSWLMYSVGRSLSHSKYSINNSLDPSTGGVCAGGKDGERERERELCTQR